MLRLVFIAPQPNYPQQQGKKYGILAFDWSGGNVATVQTPDWTNGQTAEVCACMRAVQLAVGVFV